MTIGDRLVEQGKITPEQIQEAQAARRGPSDRIDKVLIRLGYVTEREVLEVIGEQLSIPVVDLTDIQIDPELLKTVPSKVVHRYRLIPIAREDGTLKIATSNAFDIYALDELRMLTGLRVEPVLASEEEINRVIKQHYGVGGQTIDDMIEDDLEVVSDTQEVEGDLAEMAQEATIVKLVNEILLEAIRDRASDVHIEPYEGDLKIRYRLDGVLHTTHAPPQIVRFQSAIISRIKILSNLNIAERRLPQDGGFKIRAQNREIDIRVSILPTSFGEAVVMRILDKQAADLTLHKLGMADDTHAIFETLISQPHGIILVTGPTGSGKTTTLYSALNAIVSDKVKILTVEDPIEYYLDGVNQVQINPRIGLTFAAALRSFLRHDPDIILVGEIRDRETAEVAINASLTGHLVFSTLHTNDASTAPTRLLDMGVEPFLVSSSVEGIMAQRLLRTICKHCKTAYDPDPGSLPSDFELQEGEKLYRGEGCRHCRNTGYAGRIGIFELIKLTDRLREMIVQRVSAGLIRNAAVKEGLKLLRLDGWDKVRAGTTTPEEVLRVTKAM